MQRTADKGPDRIRRTLEPEQGTCSDYWANARRTEWGRAHAANVLLTGAQRGRCVPVMFHVDGARFARASEGPPPWRLRVRGEHAFSRQRSEIAEHGLCWTHFPWV